jgi:hypothetical protein
MKKTITTITLAVVMTFGATFAHANGGIIVAGSPDTQPCTPKTTDGIIVAGMPQVIGTVVTLIDGIIVAGNPTPEPCTTATDGIIVAG